MTEDKPHHRLGTIWSPEVKAKISASKILDKEKNPDLWDRLYQVTLERIKIIQEINGISS